jgi:putative endonuclease
MSHFIYILHSSKLDRYYVGQSADVDVRLTYHNNPIEARKYTRKGIPWTLVFKLKCSSKAHAMAVERFLKRMKSRRFTEDFIRSADLQNDILKRPHLVVNSPEASG